MFFRKYRERILRTRMIKIFAPMGNGAITYAAAAVDFITTGKERSGC